MIVQPALRVDPDIAVRIASGELFRNGSVVRSAATGQIVKHLDEVALPVARDAAAKAGTQLSKRVKDPKLYVPIGIIVGTVAVVSVAGYAWKKRQTDATAPSQDTEIAAIPACVERYNTSLANYLKAIQGQRLSVEILDRLIADLDEVRNYSDPDGRITLDFSTDHADTVVDIVVNYTAQLAEANSIDVSGVLPVVGEEEDNRIDLLGRHLRIQRDIFKDAS